MVGDQLAGEGMLATSGKGDAAPVFAPTVQVSQAPVLLQAQFLPPRSGPPGRNVPAGEEIRKPSPGLASRSSWWGLELPGTALPAPGWAGGQSAR